MNPNLNWLCESLKMPQVVTDQILQIADQLDVAALEPTFRMLFQEDTWDEGEELLKAALAPDPLGIRMLTCHLLCALKTHANYISMGIAESVFLATMDCFPRFVGEHMESFGCYGFDRDFWSVRQLAGKIFRIGLLEYELHDDVIDIHIPSGTRLTQDAIAQSIQEGRSFITHYFPQWKDAPMVCHSWLLSPTLRQLLPEVSGIVTFQNFFTITPTGEEDNSFYQWAFKREDLSLDQLPENTSLQRSLKQHLLQGGRFEDAKGKLK
ncbi:MAG: DUF5596 domain-containing protein [Oscillospiraceae bacterium]|nr:DUF5596 domain-containing protein [Oscillospiraceae bacterium]